MINTKHTQTYPYTRTVLDLWCMHEVDARADWCRSNCEQPFEIFITYRDPAGIPITRANYQDEADAFIDETQFAFTSDQDRLLFVLRWC